MIYLVSKKTGKKHLIKPVERNGQKLSAKEEAQRIALENPGKFFLEEAAPVKNKKSKKILDETTSPKEG